MVRGLVVLLAANALGEALRRGFGLPVSGPVLGMLFLFLLFALRGVPEDVECSSQPLLRHLSLFFVPAGVGVVTQLGLVRHEWLAMALALLGSSIVGMLATAAALHGLDRVLAVRPETRSVVRSEAPELPMLGREEQA